VFWVQWSGGSGSVCAVPKMPALTTELTPTPAFSTVSMGAALLEPQDMNLEWPKIRAYRAPLVSAEIKCYDKGSNFTTARNRKTRAATRAVAPDKETPEELAKAPCLTILPTRRPVWLPFLSTCKKLDLELHLTHPSAQYHTLSPTTDGNITHMITSGCPSQSSKHHPFISRKSFRSSIQPTPVSNQVA